MAGRRAGDAAADRRLVARLLDGDEAAFEELFEGHFPPLYRFALNRVGHDPEVAEEVVQAALARAATRLASYRGEAALLTWLTTFCRHEISSHFERRGRRPPEVELVEDRPEVRAALESLRLDQGDPEQAAARAELARRVRAVLDALPARYADALEWKYIEGLAVREIAGRLGLGSKAAESLLTRAREAFRDAFAALEPEEGRP